MASIPNDPKDQFFFFFDNPAVAGEPGGKALIKAFNGLMGSLLGYQPDDKTTPKASLFGQEPLPFAAALGAEAGTGGDKGGKGKANGGEGHHADDGIALALSLLNAFGRGELDI